MKKNQNVNKTKSKTNPQLLMARSMLSSYAASTGAIVCITDQNYLTIPEIFEEITTKKIVCLYCIKHQLNIQINNNQDYTQHPCRELHISEMKKTINTGCSSCYKCDLGFIFWTSPVYSGKRYIGSLTGSGFLHGDKNETAEKMELLGKGTVNKQELLETISIYPQADEQQIRALAELMLICAESVSRDSVYQETLKRRNEQQKKISAIPEILRKKYPAGTKQYQYHTEMEKDFLKAVHCGDTDKSLYLLYNLLGSILLMYPGDFRNIQFRIMELAIILSRTENAYNIYSFKNHQYIKSIEEAKNLEDLVDTIHLMTEYLTEEAFSFKGIRHISALKKADQYIQNNFSRKLSLEEIAEASGLSAPYFSTIFREEMGENLSCYLNRLRVEKACRLLAETDMMIFKIAISCGIEDQSWFSKIFKIYTGMNPGQYRQMKRHPSMEIPVVKLSSD